MTRRVGRCVVLLISSVVLRIGLLAVGNNMVFSIISCHINSLEFLTIYIIRVNLTGRFINGEEKTKNIVHKTIIYDPRFTIRSSHHLDPRPDPSVPPPTHSSYSRA